MGMGMVSSEYVTSMVLALTVYLAVLFGDDELRVRGLGVEERLGALLPMLKLTIVFLNTAAANRAGVNQRLAKS